MFFGNLAFSFKIVFMSHIYDMYNFTSFFLTIAQYRILFEYTIIYLFILLWIDVEVTYNLMFLQTTLLQTFLYLSFPLRQRC